MMRETKALSPQEAEVMLDPFKFLKRLRKK